MDFKQQPSLIQNQKQNYIPNLLQGVQLLQFNRMELSTYLTQHVLDNPFIEMPQKENQLLDRALSTQGPPIEQTTSSRQSLYEFLKEQIELFYRHTYLRELTFWWLNQVDDKGFVTKTMNEALDETGASQTQLLDALTLLQQLDPPGIGARNLQESLMLQTERYEQAPEIAYIILEEHFQDLVDKKWSDLSDFYSVSVEEVKNVYAFIQSLTPSPGEAFVPAVTPYILPELSVTFTEGELIIEETQYKTPLLSFNNEYFNEMKTRNDPQVLEYINRKKKEFDSLQSSLNKRKETIERVGSFIILHQHAFFQNKSSGLVPLQLSDIARELQLSESTISRAVRESYIQTPSGTYELKHFLSRRSGSSELSKDQVSQVLQTLIEEEDKKKPLSDQILSEQLKEKDIVLSRRGVTKYRKQLGIPSSTQRKET